MHNIHCKKPFSLLTRQRENERFLFYADETLKENGIVVPEERRAIGKALAALYNAKNRFYHTVVHVNYMFDTAKVYFAKRKVSKTLTLSPSEKLAILFHDVVCKAGQSQNEARSIDLMIMMMAGYGVPISEYCWASRIIKETANFMQVVQDESTHAVLDLDLAALAAPWTDFVEQNRLIGLELPGVTSLQRASFLNRFLQKERIFYRLSELEESARNNIMRYVKMIEEQCSRDTTQILNPKLKD